MHKLDSGIFGQVKSAFKQFDWEGGFNSSNVEFRAGDEDYSGLWICFDSPDIFEDDIDDSELTEDCQDVNEDGLLTSSVDVCVGAFDWSGEYTTVPVMGDDGTRWTVGYMQDGQLPKFKIYDASKGVYLDAVASEIIPWSYNVINTSEITWGNFEFGTKTVSLDSLCLNCK